MQYIIKKGISYDFLRNLYKFVQKPDQASNVLMILHLANRHLQAISFEQLCSYTTSLSLSLSV